MADGDYDPCLVDGASYFPDISETWYPFTADADTVERFEARKVVLRQHVADVFLALCEPTRWVGMIEQRSNGVGSRNNGQALVRTAFGMFSHENESSLIKRAGKLRGAHWRIVGAEDPTDKLSDVLKEFNDLRMVPFGASNYTDVWLAETFQGMLEHNNLYQAWRLSGGDTSLLTMTAPAMIPYIVTYFQSNEVEFGRMLKTNNKAARASSRASEGFKGRGKGGGGGGRDLSKIECYACGKYGHYAADCRSGGKNGKGRGKGGGKGGKFGKAKLSKD